MKNEGTEHGQTTRSERSPGGRPWRVSSGRTLILSLLALTSFTNAPDKVHGFALQAGGRGEPELNFDRGLEGVWDVVVTARDPAGNPLPSFRAMNMYLLGGQFEEFGVRTPASQRGPGMGVWRPLGGDRFNAVLEFFRFNADGTFAGTQKVTRTIELGKGGNSFTSNSEVQIFDQMGNLLSSSLATETATRFK